MRVRVPVELENAVIGCVLLQPDVLVDLDWLEADHFASSGARAAWVAIRNLEASGSPIDFVTVLEAMQRTGDGAAEKAEAMLGECLRSAPPGGDVHVYAEQVRNEAIGRRVRLELERVANANASDGAELLSMALAAISKLDTGIPEQSVSMHELIKRRMKQLEQIAQDRASGVRTMTGYPTGVAKLDDLLGGWQPKIASIVCARPGMGKSSLGLATADACSAAGFGVHLFSLEDTEEAYADRGVSRASGVPAEAMRNVSMTSVQMRDMSAAIGKFVGRRWLIDSRSGISAEEIVRAVRKHRRANDTRVVIVDYVQLVKARRDTSRHEALTEIVTTLADAAKHDDIAYVIMSQLNRDVEKRTDKRPQMSDLRESGSLEERAKCVVGIYRGAYYSRTPVEGVDYAPNEPKPTAGEFARQVQLLVLKNNNGRTGEIRAEFDGPTTRMQ
jgi:replicative DNA helicase